MTRVAYICADPGIPVFGSKGSSVHVQSVLDCLKRMDFSVVLHALRCGGPAPEALRSVALKLLPAPPRGEAEARARALLETNRELSRALEDSGPYDLIYERYSLWSHAGMAFARAAGIPGILEVNAPLIAEQARHRDMPLPGEAHDVARRAFRDASTIIAVSPGVADYLDTFKEARGKVEIVANGIDPRRFAGIRRTARDATAPFVVGFLGTLKPWHGLPVLMEAFALLRRTVGDARLLIVGDGPERPALAARLAELGIAGVTDLAGAVAPAAVPDMLQRMDVGVAPYARPDGFYFSPLKIYEYMAAGLPVVTTRVGHLERLVRHGETGLVCPPDDPAAIGAALEVLAAQPGLRARLGQAARKHALADCTWDAAVTRILRAAGVQAPKRRAVA